VAASAVTEIRDTLFAMLFLDLGRTVLVTGIAGVAGHGIGMAYSALRRTALAVVEREGVGAVK
jgi:hypothetical protein